MTEALPSHAVQINGLKTIPDGGEPFFVVKNETMAKLICEIRHDFREKKNNNKEEMSGSNSKVTFQNRRERRKFFSGKKEFV